MELKLSLEDAQKRRELQLPELEDIILFKIAGKTILFNLLVGSGLFYFFFQKLPINSNIALLYNTSLILYNMV